MKLLTLLFIFPLCLSGQTAKQWAKLAKAAAEEQDYFGAAHYYQKAVDQDSTDLKYQLALADAYRGYNAYKKAGKLYDKVAEKDENFKFTTALLYSAMMHQQQGLYDDAIKRAKEFVALSGGNLEQEIRKARQLQKSCEWAKQHLADSAEVNITQLPDPINTNNSEIAGFLADSNLIYSRVMRVGKEESTKTNAQFWKTKFSTNDIINPTKLDIGKAPGLIANYRLDTATQLIYFSVCDADGCDIFKLPATNLNAPPKALPAPLNQPNSNETQATPAIVLGKNYIVFSSDREGSRGGYDLFIAEMKDDRIIRIKNAGSKINTPGNEVTPWFDGESLYFASDWHAGYGGYDIFKSQWTERMPATPENMMAGINTPANDLYYQSDKNIAVFSSNRDGSLTDTDESCCNDLYLAISELPQEEELFVALDSLETADSIVSSITTTSLSPELKKLQSRFPLTVYFDNDQPDSKSTSTTTNRSFDELSVAYYKRRDEYVAQLKNEENAELKQAAIKDFFKKEEHSYRRLQVLTHNLFEALEAGDSVKVVVKGYASPLAASGYNKNLSKRRIQSVINFWNIAEAKPIKPYLQSGALQIVEEPYGEQQADAGVSDNIEQLGASVYGRTAAEERRVELIRVESNNSSKTTALTNPLYFETKFYDFGKLKKNSTQNVVFSFTNQSSAAIKISNIETSCGCTTADYTDTPIAAGQEGRIVLTLDTEGKLGKDITQAKITLENSPIPTILTISGTVE